MVDRLIKSWAEEPLDAGDVDDPGEAMEQVGLQAGQILGHDEFNYILRQLMRCPRVYDKLEEAAEALPAGRVAIVNEYDPATQPGAQKWTYTNAGVSLASAVAVDGRYVYIVITNNVLALDRTAGTVVATLALTGAREVCSDGARVFVAVSTGGVDTVKAYDPPDPTTGWGAALWTSADLGDVIHSVYSDGDAVFVGQVPDGGGNSVRRLSRVDGTTTWSSTAHADIVKSVVSDGESLWIGGDPDGAVVVRLLNRTTGAGEDSANAPGTCEQLCLVGARQGGRHDGANRPYIIAVGLNDAVQDVVAYDDTLTSVWATAVAATSTATGVCFDGRNVWVVTEFGPANPHLFELDLDNGSTLRTVDWNVPTVYGVATDGFGLFIVGDKPATTDQIAWRRHLLRLPGLVVKTAGTERWRWPWHIGILPAEHGPAGPAFTD